MTKSRTSRHDEAEQKMRDLLDDAGLPEPDEVRQEFEPDEVVFIWHETKTAIVVELDEGSGSAEPLPVC
jgi:hypothetical protein